MRILGLSIATLIVVLAGTSLSRAQGDLAAVIDKAIKAHGGEANINKHKAGFTKAKGTVMIQGNPVEFTEEATYHLPHKLKSVQEIQIAGQSVRIMVGYDGKKAWLNVNGMNIDMKLEQLADLMKEQEYLSEIARLTTLKDKAYELSSLGEAKVRDKPAVGIRVASKGHKDVNLYFDKDSGLLIKIEHRTVDFNTEKEVNEERIILEYQDKDGVKEAKKALVNRDGEKYVEAEVLEVKYLDDIDDSQFSKP
jgi:hypothetical protein